MKFLVVDDEHDVETLFRQKLRKEINTGLVDLVFAFSAQEALDIVKSKNPPDVVYIFSDINMPGMTGIQLLEKVKIEYPNIQVSVISAYGDADSQNSAIKSGAKLFFSKPINFELVKEEINNVMLEFEHQ
jgi:CheY-like chemotaxis protein